MLFEVVNYIDYEKNPTKMKNFKYTNVTARIQ